MSKKSHILVRDDTRYATERVTWYATDIITSNATWNITRNDTMNVTRICTWFAIQKELKDA